MLRGNTMKTGTHLLKAFLTGILLMVAWKWANNVIVRFSEENFELTMSVFHFAFLIGTGLVILFGAILLFSDWRR